MLLTHGIAQFDGGDVASKDRDLRYCSPSYGLAYLPPYGRGNISFPRDSYLGVLPGEIEVLKVSKRSSDSHLEGLESHLETHHVCLSSIVSKRFYI